jgi:hypothetical protein
VQGSEIKPQYGEKMKRSGRTAYKNFLALVTLRKEDPKFKDSLNYTVRHCHSQKKYTFRFMEKLLR